MATRTDTSAPEGIKAPAKAIEGRSLGRIAWTRLKRDKAAMAGGITVILLILMAVFAPLIVGWLGHPPNEFHQDNSLLAAELGGLPRGDFLFFESSGISGDFLFGLEPQNGRDLFSEIVYGARVSLLIAFLATLVSVVIGSALGVIAGFFGGLADTVISFLMNVFLAFPLLLFAIALVGVLPDTAFGLSGNSLRIALLIFIIGFFNWPYIARIVRGQTLSLREREFVDAARSLGARGPYIIVKEMLPNLVAPILVYATLLIPTNILFEAALSFLGVGVQRQVVGEPGVTWGGLLSDAARNSVVHFMFFPGMAIFITVLAFNLFGDGLRDALDPKSKR
ncbi:ABC transporter permease [Catellatospora paridis]|uniref:ABC transporter permease n=1 Tax=Catellatospora paridis TaxID=1617086 RepID=UPI0012D44875|nr:ABC transporter permease [Catellatospora paridis]